MQIVTDKDFQVNADKAWIQRYGGGKFHILDPRSEEIDIEDIGHALGNLCRYTGHVRKFYSVAEHSVMASYIVPPHRALRALLHDSSEAYVADLNRPLKHFTAVGPVYHVVEKKIQDLIYTKYGIDPDDEEAEAEVKKADNAMLYAEKAQLLPPMSWDTKWGAEPVSAPVVITGWSPNVAKTEFLHRFYELTNQL